MFIILDFAKYNFLTLWSRKDVGAHITNKNRYHLNRKEFIPCTSNENGESIKDWTQDYNLRGTR